MIKNFRLRIRVFIRLKVKIPWKSGSSPDVSSPSLKSEGVKSKSKSKSTGQVRVHVHRSQVQVKVPKNGTRVRLESKSRTQVLHLWSTLATSTVPQIQLILRAQRNLYLLTYLLLWHVCLNVTTQRLNDEYFYWTWRGRIGKWRKRPTLK